MYSRTPFPFLLSDQFKITSLMINFVPIKTLQKNKHIYEKKLLWLILLKWQFAVNSFQSYKNWFDFHLWIIQERIKTWRKRGENVMKMWWKCDENVLSTFIWMIYSQTCNWTVHIKANHKVCCLYLVDFLLIFVETNKHIAMTSIKYSNFTCWMHSTDFALKYQHAETNSIESNSRLTPSILSLFNCFLCWQQNVCNSID